MSSAIYDGAVIHRRRGRIEHAFEHPLAAFWLDLDELDVLERRFRLFTVDRPGLVAFRHRDHFDGGGPGLANRFREYLSRNGVDATGLRLHVLTQCRIAGYVFNPLSLYWASDPCGGVQAVVAEVNNTFGERHHYVLARIADAAAVPPVRRGSRVSGRTFTGSTRGIPCEDGPLRDFAAPKRFHVSPFLSMNGHYRFHVPRPGSRLSLCIAEEEASSDTSLEAVWTGKRRPLSDRALAGLVLRRPLRTWGVTAAIHWQALRLWLRGAPFDSHPERRAAAVSRTEEISP